MLREKKCLKCGVSSNNARFDYILNRDGTPKAYRSRCYDCKHHVKRTSQPTMVINKTSVSVLDNENLSPAMERIEINDIDDSDEYCYYTGILLDTEVSEYQKKEMILKDNKKVYVCSAIKLLKGSMSDRDFNKIINYLKVFSKSRKRRITPFDKQSDTFKEYLQNISDDNNLSIKDLDDLRREQGDCCYLSNIRMTWESSKWNRGILTKNKDDKYCLAIPLFSKLKRSMTEDTIKDILQALIKHDKCS